jgi:hypothetical protein
MTMEDQGIMALPQGQAMQGPTAQPAAPQNDPASMAAFEQMRMQADPKEFGEELLTAAAEVDPVAVQQFLRVIMEMQLPPEVIDALGQMVDAVLAEPEKYQEIRAEFIREGVPQELLPPEFDAAYFGAMNLALDQMSARAAAPSPQGFANGGIATIRTPIAAGLAKMGRNGDTMLAHITPSEARLLRRRGGSGTINPVTGMPEFFLKKIAKAVGNTLKNVGKAISNTVKSIGGEIKRFANSTVGRIVTTVALGFFLGPAAAGMLGVTSAAGVAAVSGFIGSAGSTLLAGGSVKDALKAGAMGGLTAGAGAGVFGGADAFAAGSYTGPTTISGQFESLTNKLSSLGGTTPTTTPTGAAPNVPDTTAMATQNVPQGLPAPIEAPPMVANAPGAGTQVAGNATNIGPVPGTPVQQTPADFIRANEFRDFGQTGLNFDLNTPTDIRPGFNMGEAAINRATPEAFLPGQQESLFPQARGPVSIGPEKSFFSRVSEGAKNLYGEYLDPSRNVMSRDELLSEAAKIQKQAGMTTQLDAFGRPQQVPALSFDKALSMAEKAQPGAFARYAPLVATGTGIAALSGAFSPEPEKPLNIAPKKTGFDLLREDPSKYGVTPGGANIIYGPYLTTPPRFAQGGIAAMAPRRFNLGGYAAGGIGNARFPRKTGPINGPGTGTSDSIPAMLSDGEFVFTAKAVRGAGKGSRREGAKRMYAMMKALERKA